MRISFNAKVADECFIWSNFCLIASKTGGRAGGAGEESPSTIGQGAG